MTDGTAQFARWDHRAGPVLGVSGEVDVATAGEFRQALRRLIDDARAPAFVDLAAVEFIDSSGIKALVLANEQAKRARVTLTLRAPSVACRRVFDALGLNDYFTMN